LQFAVLSETGSKKRSTRCRHYQFVSPQSEDGIQNERFEPAKDQSTGLVAERLNNYGGNNDLTNPIANGDGFTRAMTPPGSDWHVVYRFFANHR